MFYANINILLGYSKVSMIRVIIRATKYIFPYKKSGQKKDTINSSQIYKHKKILNVRNKLLKKLQKLKKLKKNFLFKTKKRLIFIYLHMYCIYINV